MEILKKLLLWLSPFPFWVRCLLLALISAVIALMSLFSVSSCGITQTFVNNENSDNASVQLDVVPSQSTSTSVNPTIQYQP